jgi:RluA family pseudouridine synthase
MTRKRIITSRIPLLLSQSSLECYLAGRFSYLTQNQWRNEISCGKILLNGSIVTDPATPINGGETLAWDGSYIIEPNVDERIAVLYEDECMIAVNKTGNLPVHPSGRYFNNTLVSMLEDRYGRKVYPAHRIDRETSGVILLAFDGKCAGAISESLAMGSKEYLALVHGLFPGDEMIVDLPLGSDHESNVGKKRKAKAGGTETALTRFRNVLWAGQFSLIRCFPETGRLHQIRAHLEAAGYPIVGDKLYGRDKNAFLDFIRHGFTAEMEKRLLIPRSALHAARLVFLHPRTRKRMIVRAPLPKMFADFIREQKNKTDL